uniref:Uncharacterized protein n=1 Tax=Placozoa sp. H2 TaxID=573895 RepID=A0A7I6N7M1_9METZ|nr:hypothetical protein [Placozoa sp. H2 HM-2017]
MGAGSQAGLPPLVRGVDLSTFLLPSALAPAPFGRRPSALAPAPFGRRPSAPVSFPRSGRQRRPYSSLGSIGSFLFFRRLRRPNLEEVIVFLLQLIPPVLFFRSARGAAPRSAAPRAWLGRLRRRGQLVVGRWGPQKVSSAPKAPVGRSARTVCHRAGAFGARWPR